MNLIEKIQKTNRKKLAITSLTIIIVLLTFWSILSHIFLPIDLYEKNNRKVISLQVAGVQEATKNKMIDLNIINNNVVLHPILKGFSKKKNHANKTESGSVTYLLNINEYNREFYVLWEKDPTSEHIKISSIQEYINSEYISLFKM